MLFRIRTEHHQGVRCSIVTRLWHRAAGLQTPLHRDRLCVDQAGLFRVDDVPLPAPVRSHQRSTLHVQYEISKVSHANQAQLPWRRPFRS